MPSDHPLLLCVAASAGTPSTLRETVGPGGGGHRFALREVARSLLHSARALPAAGIALAMMSPAAFADSGPACNGAISGACQIIYTEGSAGHSDTGAMPPPIASLFSNAQTLTGVDGPAGWGAIQLETVAGDGGAADSDGKSGGNGGMGSDVSATVGSAVTATGINSGGLGGSAGSAVQLRAEHQRDAGRIGRRPAIAVCHAETQLHRRLHRRGCGREWAIRRGAPSVEFRGRRHGAGGRLRPAGQRRAGTR